MTAQDLAERRCQPCTAATPPLTEAEIAAFSRAVPDWEVRDGKEIERRFRFRDFAATMAFVNEVAAIAEEEDHHPDLHIFYNRLTIDLSTHAIKGLSANDFIVAAKIDRLAGIQRT